MKSTHRITLTILGTALTTTAFAQGDLIANLTANWSGTNNGNQATATFDLNLTALNNALNNNGGTIDDSLANYISNLTMLVSGADVDYANGTFTTSDFQDLTVTANGPLSFNGDWANQANLADFGFSRASGTAPSYSNYTLKQMVTFNDGGPGDAMNLISGRNVTPTPEPGSLALLGLGGMSALLLALAKRTIHPLNQRLLLTFLFKNL